MKKGKKFDASCLLVIYEGQLIKDDTEMFKDDGEMFPDVHRRWIFSFDWFIWANGEKRSKSFIMSVS